MCDCFYLCGQARGRDSVGSSLCAQSSHPAWLWIPNQTGPMWLSCPCRSRCHVACRWLQQAFVLKHWFFQLAINGSVCLGSLTVVGLELNCTFSPVSYLLELCETAHMLDPFMILLLTVCTPILLWEHHGVDCWDSASHWDTPWLARPYVLLSLDGRSSK